MGRPKAPLGMCQACGAEFQQRRRGDQRERRCPQCVREWRWSGRQLHRLSCRKVGSVGAEETGGVWPELVAAELEKAR